MVREFFDEIFNQQGFR